MELRQLAHFVAVAEEQSFTRAARRMHIVQSGISTSIAALERELGTELFRRSRHHVELTQSGRVLLEGARRALSAVNDAQAAVRRATDSITGVLRVGVMQAIPPRLRLSSLLRDFLVEYPGVFVDVRRLTSPTYDELRTGEVDIAIGPGHAPDGITSIPLGQYPYVLAVRDAHPLARRASVTLAMAAHEPQVAMPKHWVARRLVDRAFDDAGLERRIVAESNDFVLLLGLVASGIGVGIVPDVVARFGSSVRFVPIKPSIGDWSAALLHVGSEPSSPAARALVEMFTSRRDAYGP